ncbi:MAG: aminoglycoside 6-adenylyltransferase [Parachlamydiaceae bacterium]|nr:aminoglycoside 6-adenylyltransferase [Parachlamydiaceae bacterium]
MLFYIDSILAWAKSEKSIRVLMLVGSRATDKPINQLSDYDLAIFSIEDCKYIHDDQWLSKIGKVWACVHERIYRENREVPTRLVIFEGGSKVDFTFFSLAKLKEIINGSLLPPEYDMGYKILLDKDALTVNMPKPRFKGFSIKKPSEAHFVNVINEFWFEAYHVAVYLKRGDLWSAKARTNGIHYNFLLKMIEWNELSKHDWNYCIPPMGKWIQSWVCESTQDALYGLFGHFDTEDSWKALLNTIGLFRNLAKESAQILGFSYAEDVDNNISKFILKLHDK